MPIDFSKISRSKTGKRPQDPIELFQNLRITDSAINDLWLAQGEALREWHKHRSLGDVAIALNTGAGKTLVGLLAAQSLVNETLGHVLYACSSIQLVKQTARMATGYGLDVTTYVQKEFSNDLYQQGLAPCITTYQALFNGKSRFFRQDIAAIVFDDAHTAGHLLRDHFTLHIPRSDFPDLFAQIFQLFQLYFTRIGAGVGYAETYNLSNPLVSWFVPPFALHAQIGALQDLLLEARLSEQTNTLFAWAHLRDHLDLCTLFISGQEIILTPPVVPVGTLPYFKKGVRRLYLSATLAANDAFLRTFGKILDHRIAPVTTAGECERLILVPSMHPNCEDDVVIAKRIIEGRKALILVPSYRRAIEWKDVALIPEEDVAAQVDAFRNSTQPTTLVLVGRYDGVDLPGDTCRLLIIDDLPSSLGQLERFMWERLGLVKSLRSTVAARVVQSFGRISRGMSDYGVVVLTGKSLVNWLLDPKDLAILPPFLRRQLDLGLDISKNADSLSDIEDAAQQCLARDPNWLQFYQDYEASEAAVGDTGITDEDALAIAKAEVNFGNALWSREYSDAARALDRALNETFRISTNIGAWHALWLGYCYELMGDRAAATSQYRRAHSALKAIPPYDIQTSATNDPHLPAQVVEVVRLLQGDLQIQQQELARLADAITTLHGAAVSKPTEEALRIVGEFLGLQSSRPDNEFHTGPDVLWDTPGGPVLSLEVKTNKESGTPYRKRDISQVYNHIQWVRDNTLSQPIYSAFVGPCAPAAPDANPSADIMIIELDEFRALASRLQVALADICTQAVLANLASVVAEVFGQRHLLWPDVYGHLTKYALRDIAAK